MLRRAVLAALILLWLSPAGPAQAKETSGPEPAVFPTYVWVAALGNEPESYAYWTTDCSWRYRRFDATALPERGIGFPSVLREVGGPGHVSVSFRFYDGEDRLVGSTEGCVVVDAFGVAIPCSSSGEFRDYDYWPHWRSSWSSASGGDEPTLFELPWPQVELAARLSGDGPWRVECEVSGNFPAKWFQTFEWDLDHDGRFSRTTGRRPGLSVELSQPGTYIFTVRATDMRGYRTMGEVQFSVGAER